MGRSGGTSFRRRVWLPALVRAGLLGEVVRVDDGNRARWRGDDGHDRAAVCPTELEAVAQVVRHARDRQGGWGPE
jgi:hypothetical protein